MPHSVRDIDFGKDCPPDIGTRYIIKKELGSGSYGTVYQAIDTVTNETVAIKCIKDVFRSYTDAKRTLREISILHHCNHKSIAKLLNILQTDQNPNYDDLWIVMEYGGWDLLKILKNYRKINGWCSKYVKYIIYQLLCAINYLDSANIVHRDLKPSNLLMNDKCDLKLIDFGLARQILPNNDIERIQSEASSNTAEVHPEHLLKRQLTKHVVTRWYRAPEIILLQEHYDSAVDIWSVGCIMAELLQTLEPKTTKPQPLFPGTTCFPLSTKVTEKNKYEKLEQEFRLETHELLKIFAIIGTPSDEEIDAIQNPNMRDFLKDMMYIPPKDLHELFPSIEEEGLLLLQKMLLFDPKKRITAAEAIQSPYFDSIRKKELEKTISKPFFLDYEYNGLDSYDTNMTTTSIFSSFQSGSFSFLTNKLTSQSGTAPSTVPGSSTAVPTTTTGAEGVRERSSTLTSTMANSNMSVAKKEKRKKKLDEQYMKYYKQLLNEEIHDYLSSLPETDTSQSKKKKHKNCTIL